MSEDVTIEVCLRVENERLKQENAALRSENNALRPMLSGLQHKLAVAVRHNTSDPSKADTELLPCVVPTDRFHNGG